MHKACLFYNTCPYIYTYVCTDKFSNGGETHFDLNEQLDISKKSQSLIIGNVHYIGTYVHMHSFTYVYTYIHNSYNKEITRSEITLQVWLIRSLFTTALAIISFCIHFKYRENL